MEYFGHLEGMLDRDQRTAKLRVYSSDDVFHELILQDKTTAPGLDNNFSRHCCHPSKTKTYDTYLKWKSGLLHNLKNFRNFLIVGFYFILVVLPPVRCAPSSLPSVRLRMREEPKWINPCGFPSATPTMAEPNVPAYINDYELLKPIVAQAVMAFNKTNSFKKVFTRKTFKKPFEEISEHFKNHRYRWLSRPVSWSEMDLHPKDLKHDDNLLDSYEYLQRLAVGLEQVVWDQERNGILYKGFRDTEDNLRLVLCEIQNAIAERGIVMRDDVTRDVMGEEYRRMNTTNSRQRDFIILRDYIEALEFIIQSFGHSTESS